MYQVFNFSHIYAASFICLQVQFINKDAGVIKLILADYHIFNQYPERKLLDWK